MEACQWRVLLRRDGGWLAPGWNTRQSPAFGASGAGGTVTEPDLEFIVNAVGISTWQVGSYFDPGPLSTPFSDFPRITLLVTGPAKRCWRERSRKTPVAILISVLVIRGFILLSIGRLRRMHMA